MKTRSHQLSAGISSMRYRSESWKELVYLILQHMSYTRNDQVLLSRYLALVINSALGHIDTAESRYEIRTYGAIASSTEQAAVKDILLVAHDSHTY